MRSVMNSRRWLSAVVVVAAAIVLAGCASAGPGTPTPLHTPDDPFACGIGIGGSGERGTEVAVGATIRIARSPGPECLTLTPGSTQHIEFETRHGDGPGTVTTPGKDFEIAADGSFSTEMTIPETTRIGFAQFTLVPSTGAHCESGGTTGGECILPRIYVTPVVPAENLSPVEIVQADAPRPPATFDADGTGFDAFALRGPQPGQLTMVLPGGGCVTVPKSYDTTADPGTLALFSGLEADGDPLCTDLLRSWTTVITIPDGFEDFEVVTVDNVPATLRDTDG